MSHFHTHPSFFDLEVQLDKIHALNDFLVRLNILINWSIFLAPLSTLRYEVTNAAVHDSIPCLDLMPPEPLYPGQEVHLDSAYLGSKHNPIIDDLKERGFNPQICEKGVRNHPLTPVQRFCNSIKSSIRCRIEHIFGAQKKRMGDEILRTIGLKRARFWIGMRNLVSNMCRMVTLNRQK